MKRSFDIIIVGGGAAGFFTAINILEKNPTLNIAILEKNNEVLSKVRISGGGRCNLAHACFQPKELVKFYPRGEKELLSAFHRFSSKDTMQWFEAHGVPLKIEEDGRIFPASNTSQSVVDCLLKAFHNKGGCLITGVAVISIQKENSNWEINTSKESFYAQKLVIASGSNRKIWDIMQSLGHKIVQPVPSLFTFNIIDERLKSLQGISTTASLEIKGTKLRSTGALLFTHWGFSGPAILKLSAWGARILSEKEYKFALIVNFLNDICLIEAIEILGEQRLLNPKKTIAGKSPFNTTESNPNINIPNRLWEFLVLTSGISTETKWAELSKKQLQTLATNLIKSEFSIDGKSTFKEEFVTAGGIDLKEINFKTMESKLFPSLFFAGEVIDVDAVTGGFNFQNAWTTSFIVAEDNG